MCPRAASVAHGFRLRLTLSFFFFLALPIPTFSFWGLLFLVAFFFPFFFFSVRSLNKIMNPLLNRVCHVARKD